MRLIFFLILVSVASLSAVHAEDYKFPPPVLELIEKYGGTEKPVFPDPLKIKELEDKYTYPPARQHLPVNVIINKRKTRLYVVNVFGDTLDSYPVCCSRNRGQKKSEDDCRTPEGTFAVVGVYNSTDWRYKKVGEKCYGPYFVSLATPGFYGIGIHGTNAPYSVPGRSSHGCIRLHNDNIKKLRKWVNKDTRVTILPDDPEADKKEQEKIRDNYVGPGQTVTRRVTDDEVKTHKESADKRAD